MGKTKTRMYVGVKTWNPFKGCLFDCVYCKPSFQAQAKRQKKNCDECYHYRPHVHPERLNKIPSAEIVFVSGNGDISFCSPHYTRKIIESIKRHNSRCPQKTYYFQSKRPKYLDQFISDFPDNVITMTTLETNRDNGYEKISRAPKPSERYRQFKELRWLRKVVTIEPVMDFDLDIFSGWLSSIGPEYVYVGYNSRPARIHIPEPSIDRTTRFIEGLRREGMEVRGKDLRGIEI